MDAMTRKALEGSIRHWEENLSATSPHDVSTGWKSCPLCVAFMHNNCIDCPVAAKKRMSSCHCTPYWEAVTQLKKWKDGEQEAEKEFKAAASAELDFLRSLLPAEEGAE